MGQVNLKFKETIDGETVVKTRPYEIEEIGLLQFTQTLKLLQDVIKTLNADGSVREMVESFFNGDDTADILKEVAEGAEKGEQPEIDIEELVKKADNEFIAKAVGSFEALAVRLPEKAIELLAVLSDIPLEDLQQQKLTAVLDIYDAVVEVNDIEAVINRLKKSLGATKKAMGWLQLSRKATEK